MSSHERDRVSVYVCVFHCHSTIPPPSNMILMIAYVTHYPTTCCMCVYVIAGFSFPKFNWKLKSGGGGGGGGVVLLSNKSLGSKHQSASDPGGLDAGGITLVSRRLLDTGYTDTDGEWEGSDLEKTLRRPDRFSYFVNFGWI